MRFVNNLKEKQEFPQVWPMVTIIHLHSHVFEQHTGCF